MATKTRQQRWQERRISEGKCSVCGVVLDALMSTRYCPHHLVKRREWQRKRVGSKKRYRSLSYRLAEQERNNKKLEAA